MKFIVTPVNTITPAGSSEAGEGPGALACEINFCSDQSCPLITCDRNNCFAATCFNLAGMDIFCPLHACIQDTVGVSLFTPFKYLDAGNEWDNVEYADINKTKVEWWGLEASEVRKT
ncbi:MAG: hypothetical protein FH756_14445 [Firmicutes bacterium]|nr:hypothetical protein [Bacillota bacterium]